MNSVHSKRMGTQQKYNVLMCAKKADADKLDNPARPKPNQRAGTELCTYGGNEICKAKGKVDCRP